MSKDLPIQYGFQGGELSPKMDMRYDLEGRTVAAQEMTNWWPNLQGPAETVPGFQHLYALVTTNGRLVPMSVATFCGFIIAITPTQVVITNSLGPVPLNNLVVDANFILRSGEWAFAALGAASVNFTSGACIMIAGSDAGTTCDLAQTCTVVAGEVHNLNIGFVAGDGNFTVLVSSIAGGAPDIFEGDYVGSGAVRIISITSPTTVMYITIRVGGVGSIPQIRIVDTVQLVNMTGGASYVIFTSPWNTDEDISSIQHAQPPGELSASMSSILTAPQVCTWLPETDTWSFAPIAFTSTPPEWTGTNWPVAIEFFEGRMYLGGTEKEPETFWASEVGNFLNMFFVDPDEILPTDPITHRLERHGKIRWMKAIKTMLLGTENAEYVLTSEGGVIVPGDINSRRQSANGSAIMQAIEVGNKVLYVSPDGKKIRSVVYEWDAEAWVSKDVTFGADHITEGVNRIQNLAWALNPRNSLMSVTASGNIVGATYDPANDVAGFFRRTVDGRFIAVCTLPSGGVDEVWVLVDRQVVVGSIFVEKLVATNNYFMDSHSVISYAVPSSTGTASQLAGATCWVIADGKIHPDVIPDGFGNFTLNYAASEIVIGLPIENRLESLSRDDGISTGTSTNKGSAAAAQKRWSVTYARVIKSDCPLINGQRPGSAPKIATDGTIPVFPTGSYHVTNRGIDLEAKIVFEQNRQLPVMLGGFFGDLEQN